MNLKLAALFLILISFLSLNSCTKKAVNNAQRQREIQIIKSLSKFSELFDSNKWKKADVKERYIYTNDLITNKRLNDKSKNEVLKMLGKPDLQSGNLIGYRVDIGDKNTPVWYLIISFDNNNKTDRINLSDQW